MKSIAVTVTMALLMAVNYIILVNVVAKGMRTYIPMENMESALKGTDMNLSYP